MATGKASIVISLLMLGTLTVSPRAAEPMFLSCSPDTPVVRDVVAGLIQARSGPGGLFEGADASSLQVLTNGGTSSRLRREFEDTYDVQGAGSAYVATYYQLQNRFLVHIVPREVIEPPSTTPGQVAIIEVGAQILVYDINFDEIGVFLIGV